jgi:hypothetical protein
MVVFVVVFSSAHQEVGKMSRVQGGETRLLKRKRSELKRVSVWVTQALQMKVQLIRVMGWLHEMAYIILSWPRSVSPDGVVVA